MECPGGVGHDGTLGGMLAGAPLLPGYAAPLNAIDPRKLTVLSSEAQQSKPLIFSAAVRQDHQRENRYSKLQQRRTGPISPIEAEFANRPRITVEISSIRLRVDAARPQEH